MSDDVTMIADPLSRALASCRGRRILRAWYSNTCSVADIFKVTLLLDDGSELQIGYGPASPIGQPHRLLDIRRIPMTES